MTETEIREKIKDLAHYFKMESVLKIQRGEYLSDGLPCAFNLEAQLGEYNVGRKKLVYSILEEYGFSNIVFTLNEDDQSHTVRMNYKINIRHIEISDNRKDDKWDNDEIQFPRLISEILATQDINYELLGASMNLSVDQVKELFARADQKWEMIKKG